MRLSAPASAGFCWSRIWVAPGTRCACTISTMRSSPTSARAAGSRPRASAAASHRSSASAPISRRVEGADVIIVVTGGQRQPAVATALAPLLRDGQIVLLIQGNTGGSLVVRRALDAAGCKAEGRSRRDGQLSLFLLASSARRSMKPIVHQALAADRRVSRQPHRRGVSRDCGRCSRPRCRRQTSSIPASRMPTRCCMWQTAWRMPARIERGEDYKFYAEGVIPSVARAISGDQRRAGRRSPPRRRQGADAEDWFEQRLQACASGRCPRPAETDLQRRRPLRRHGTPKSSSHKYVAEDVPVGLMPMSRARQGSRRRRCRRSDADPTTPAMMTGDDYANERAHARSHGPRGQGCEWHHQGGRARIWLTGSANASPASTKRRVADSPRLSAPFGMAAVMSCVESGEHRHVAECRALRENRIDRVEDERQRHDAARLSSRAASRRSRRRLWRYPAPGSCRHRIGRPACAPAARKCRRCGRDRSAPKSRHSPRAPVRARSGPSHAARGKSSRHVRSSFPLDRGIDAGLHRRQHRPIAVAAEDVDQLRAVGREPLPAVRFGDLARIGLIEAHAGQHDAAGVFDTRRITHAVANPA